METGILIGFILGLGVRDVWRILVTRADNRTPPKNQLPPKNRK